MRLLEYRQELFGRGYTVVSGDTHYGTMRPEKCLPIQMRLLPSGIILSRTLESIVENIQFNYDLSKGTEEEYRKKYASILLGKSPEWIIIAFQITVGEVCLDLYNTKAKETASFYLEADECGFSLRFEVPRVGGGPCAVYDVEIGSTDHTRNTARTTVTECINHARREIEFFQKNPGSDETYIEVTEYADL